MKKKDLLEYAAKTAIKKGLPGIFWNIRTEASPKNLAATTSLLAMVGAVGFACKEESNWKAAGGCASVSLLAGAAFLKLSSKEQENLKIQRAHEIRLAEIKVGGEKKSVVLPSVQEMPVQEPEENLVASWQEVNRFKNPVPMDLPVVLSEIISGTPEGYEWAMTLHILSMLGALCFSKCRAKYLDGKVHAPNIAVIIEGPYGSGKGKFEQVYQTVFQRMIQADMAKLNDDSSSSHIIQNSGVGASNTRFVEIQAKNQRCHTYFFAPEIQALVNDMKKGNGLSFEHLRYAFDNSVVYKDTKAKNSVKGAYPVYLNYTITGTPADVDKFISKELEGGTASRIAWSVIPPTEKIIPLLVLPEGAELEAIQDQLEEWHDRFCYSEQNGVEVAANEHLVDLDYVNVVLENWLSMQYDKAQKEGNQARSDARTRAAAIAFHCAIVVAMLCGEPGGEDPDARAKVVELTIAIANCVIERFLHKFKEQQNLQHQLNKNQESVVIKETTKPEPLVHGVPRKQAEEIYLLYKTGGAQMGYGTIGKRYKLDRQKVKAIILDIEKEKGLV